MALPDQLLLAPSGVESLALWAEPRRQGIPSAADAEQQTWPSSTVRLDPSKLGSLAVQKLGKLANTLG